MADFSIRSTDYLLLRLAQSAGSWLRCLGDVETELLGGRLRDISVESPVFITGLARSGTTILLEELSRLEGLGTHRYRDFPFVMTPYLWNRLLEFFPAERAPVERPHRDRICITRDSPEAFEEPIWNQFFPHVHAANRLHRLTGADRNSEFDLFFTDHIRKLLLVRRAARYLSKGNYNLARIEYLAALYPGARFIIPVRHPLTQVSSLIRQHALFSEYARQDPRVPRCLAAAGHFEFGPQRVPIRLGIESGDRVQAAWDRGDDRTGYAIQWAAVYDFVDAIQVGPRPLADRVLIVRYEDFCAQPHEVMCRILRHIDRDADVAGLQSFRHITASTGEISPFTKAESAGVWQETASVAARFGYAWPLD